MIALAPRGILILALLGAIQADAATLTVLDDSFADGGRTNDPSTPLDTDWYYAQGSTGTTLTTNGAQQNLYLNAATRSNAQVTGTFAGVTLAIGETITAAFSFDVNGGDGSTAAINDGALRFGLLNVATPVATDINSSIANTNWNSATGYSGFIDATGAASATSTPAVSNLRQRTGASTTLWAAGATSVLTTTVAGSSQLVAGNVANLTAGSLRYSALFSLTRTSLSTMDLMLTLSDAGGVLTTLSATDGSGIQDTFNTFSFFTGSSFAADFAIDNVLVTVVPEPAACSLLGLAALGCASRRRRDRIVPSI